MAYLYVSNLDLADRADQLEIQLDNGSTAILRRGHYYDLTVNELRRARQYIVLTSSATPADEAPIGVVRLEVKGNPANGQIPQWDANEGVFTPATVSGVSGGPYASTTDVTALDTRLDTVETSVGELDDVQVNIGRSIIPFADVDLTGATNSVSALQARIDALPARGGDIVWPLGAKVSISSTVTITKPNVRFVGKGGAFGGTEAGAQTWLEYTGSTRAIDARSTYGFTVENMYLTGYSLGAAGILVDFDATSNDTASMVIRDSWLRGTNNGTGILIALKNAQSGEFDHNIYMGAARAFRGTVTGGGADFSNSITLSGRSIFQFQASAPILNPNQMWSIEDQVFQQIQGATGPAGAVESQAGHLVEGFRYVGNSHQDATGGGNWVTVRGNGIEISGNFFTTGAKFVVFAGGTNTATATTTSGSANLTVVSSTQGWRNGQIVTGTGIPAGTFILSGAGTATMVMSNTATASASGVSIAGSCNGVSVHGNQFWSASTAAIDAGTTGVTNFEEDGNDWHLNTADIIGSVNADMGGVLMSPDGQTSATTGSTWPVANRALFIRYVPRKTHSAVSVAFHCTAADAGSPNGDVAVLAASRARLASSGSVSLVAATGIVAGSFTGSVVLRKGEVYYVGLGLVSATAAVAFMANFSSGTTAELISNATPRLLQGFADTSVPIANPVGALSSNASIPLLCLRTA